MIYLEECQARTAIANGSAVDAVDMDHPLAREWARYETRRQFLARGKNVVGWAALSALGMGGAGSASAAARSKHQHPFSLPHFPGKAKRVIYLHMVGGPPQMDLYDYKPVMQKYFDK